LLDEEEARLETLFVRKSDYEEEGRRLRASKLNVQDIIDNKNAIITIDGYIDLQRLRVRKAEENLEQARVRLNEAIRERKTYERLREIAFEEFVKEENSREAKEVDERVSYKHAVMR
jgi:flagellar FliJ protein